MIEYLGIKHHSNIAAYEINSDKIKIAFHYYHRYKIYTYELDTIGLRNHEEMCILVKTGTGLQSFILHTEEFFENYSDSKMKWFLHLDKKH